MSSEFIVAGYFSALLLAIVVSVWLLLRRENAPNNVFYLVFGALTLRVIYVIVDHNLGLFAGDPDGDFPLYHRILRHVAAGWHEGNLLAPFELASVLGVTQLYRTTYGFVFGPVYFVFGYQPVLVRLTMALIGTLVVFNIYRIGRQVFDHHAGLYAGGFAAGYPYFVQLSGVFYRDMLILLALTQLVYLLISWMETRDNRTFVLAVVVAVVALSLRVHNIIPIGAAFAVAVYCHFEGNRFRVPAVAASALATFLVLVTVFRDYMSIQALAGRREWLLQGNAQYLPGVVYATPVEYLQFLPLGMAYFLLVPFPWHTHNLLAVVSIGMNVLFWYPIIVLSIFGVRRLWQHSRPIAYFLLTFVAGGLLIYGSVEGNIGPAMRHRTQFQFIFFVLAGHVLAERVRVRY